MKVLITGIGGTIGRGIAPLLETQGYEVVGLARQGDISFPNSSIRVISADISSPILLNERFDIIFHAAAFTHISKDPSPSKYIDSNVSGTLNLIEFCKKFPPNFFINLSTISLYGEIVEPTVSEETPVRSTEIYGASKLFAELLVSESSNYFPSLSIRLPAVVGPGYFYPWIGQIVKKAATGEPISYFNGDSLFNNVVDFEELKKLVVHLSSKPPTSADQVNLAASFPIKVRDAIYLVTKLTGSKSKITEKRSEKCSFSILTDKLESNFGFRPSSTNDIITRYINTNRDLLNIRD